MGIAAFIGLLGVIFELIYSVIAIVGLFSLLNLVIDVLIHNLAARLE